MLKFIKGIEQSHFVRILMTMKQTNKSNIPTTKTDIELKQIRKNKIGIQKVTIAQRHNGQMYEYLTTSKGRID